MGYGVRQSPNGQAGVRSVEPNAAYLRKSKSVRSSSEHGANASGVEGWPDR